MKENARVYNGESHFVAKNAVIIFDLIDQFINTPDLVDATELIKRKEKMLNSCLAIESERQLKKINTIMNEKEHKKCDNLQNRNQELNSKPSTSSAEFKNNLNNQNSSDENSIKYYIQTCIGNLKIVKEIDEDPNKRCIAFAENQLINS